MCWSVQEWWYWFGVKSIDYGHVSVIDGYNFVKGTGSCNGGAIVI
jgi:hypothetical protein